MPLRAPLLICAAAALAAFPASASAADTLSLSLGPNPAVDGELVGTNVSGDVDASFGGGHVDIKSKPSGGPDCARSPGAESGTAVDQPSTNTVGRG